MNKLLKVTILRAAAVSGVALALSLVPAGAACAVATDAVGPPLRGMDISAFQHAGTPIDWELLARHDIRFVAVKLSEGTYYLNPYYPSDAQAAAAVGLRVLPYVFAAPNRAGGTATANFAVGAAGSLRGPARLPLVVDLENDPYAKAADCYGLSIPAMIAWIAGFTARAESLTGKWPVVYTTAAWWRECTGSTHRFRRDPLWLAAFGGTAPTVPTPWHSWTFLQYSNSGSLPGIGQTDLDYYQPTAALPALRPPVKRESRRKSKKRDERNPRRERHRETHSAHQANPKHHPNPGKHARRAAPRPRPAKPRRGPRANAS